MPGSFETTIKKEIKYPKTNWLLFRYLYKPSCKIKEPLHPVSPKRIKNINISSSKINRGSDNFINVKYDGGYILKTNLGFMIFNIPSSITYRTQKLYQEIKKWLEKWKKLNRLNFKIQNRSQRKETRQEARKTEEKWKRVHPGAKLPGLWIRPVDAWQELIEELARSKP